MKTKLNTKTIVAAVASVIGLAVYGYTSMVGYLAASPYSFWPAFRWLRTSTSSRSTIRPLRPRPCTSPSWVPCATWSAS